MTLREATQVELASVTSALADLRAHWASIPNLWKCAFAGTVADVGALDYLEYEGLGYPEPGIAGAALAWGNVLVTSGPFRWYFEESLGGLVLCPARGDDPRPQVIWPYGRVYEIHGAAWPISGEKYQWLTVKAVLDFLALGVFDRTDETRLCGLIGDRTQPDFLKPIEAALERLSGLRM